MPTNRATSHRARVLWNWTYITLMACGFATICAAVYLKNETWIGLGVTAFSLGGLMLATSLFFAHATALQALPIPNRPVPVATRPVGGARPLDFNYGADAPKASLSSRIHPPLGRSAAPAAAKPEAAGEDLVEFQLVADRDAPTQLQVPPAFALEKTVDALAEGPIAVRPVSDRTDFVPAVARRKQIVSGLPILSRVFADEAPQATQVQPRADGKTRGQCGNCGTFLWAPSERPIRLRCPRCGNVKTLTA